VTPPRQPPSPADLPPAEFHTPADLAAITAAREDLLAGGFDAAATERILTGEPTRRRTRPPRVANKGKVEGPLAGGGSTGRHTSTRGAVDGDRPR
jgi:hypothetical protein